jgi:shikimate kinase
VSLPLEGAPPLICLVGLPAVGKSTIGKSLAARLGIAFYDTDELVEESAGRSVGSIFEQDGESRFRELESDALHRVAHGQHAAVVATGGGIVTFEPNRQFLARNAFVIYLRSPLEPLVRRLARSDRRPLFQSADIAARLAALHEQRHALYLGVAHMAIDVAERGRQGVLTDILERLPPGIARRV